MPYLIGQIILCLLLAFILGAIVGWFLKSLCCKRQLAELQTQGSSENVASNFAAVSTDADQNWPYPVEEVEGIGPAYGGRLRDKNIITTEDLLEKCCEASQQTEIAPHVKVEPFVVGKWVSMSDLLRIPGIDGQYAELLEASEISSVADLIKQNSSSLATKMSRVNEQQHRTPTVPDADEVARWIEFAKGLPDKIRSLAEK